MAIHAWRGEDTAPYLSCLTANDAKRSSAQPYAAAAMVGRVCPQRARHDGKYSSDRGNPRVAR